MNTHAAPRAPDLVTQIQRQLHTTAYQMHQFIGDLQNRALPQSLPWESTLEAQADLSLGQADLSRQIHGSGMLNIDGSDGWGNGETTNTQISTPAASLLGQNGTIDLSMVGARMQPQKDAFSSLSPELQQRVSEYACEVVKQYKNLDELIKSLPNERSSDSQQLGALELQGVHFDAAVDVLQRQLETAESLLKKVQDTIGTISVKMMASDGVDIIEK
eukprot:TRINITY_DN3547_c0_g1_i2.p1 TRINITY_DN3547_c0_g1~~TRINITY_DN3547_c0_g1_i2.p1  ORF type:complete len:234 (+),score=50.07 TRINITY_DN3547_c0_g1_i2:52-702(+)